MNVEKIILLSTVLPILVAAAIAFVVFRAIASKGGGAALRKGFGMGASAGDQQQIAQLQATGRKARAHLTGVRPTGLVVNHINVGVDLTFLMEPLDGSPRFEAVKRATVSQAQMPRIGEVWPSWYDGANPSVFAVAMVTAATPETIGLYREFGIPHPLENLMSPQHGGPPPASPAPPPPPPYSAPPPPSPPMGPGPAAAMDGSKLDELERLSRLRSEGHLTEAEFQAAKTKLLYG